MKTVPSMSRRTVEISMDFLDRLSIYFRYRFRYRISIDFRLMFDRCSIGFSINFRSDFRWIFDIDFRPMFDRISTENQKGRNVEIYVEIYGSKTCVSKCFSMEFRPIIDRFFTPKKPAFHFWHYSDYRVERGVNHGPMGWVARTADGCSMEFSMDLPKPYTPLPSSDIYR